MVLGSHKLISTQTLKYPRTSIKASMLLQIPPRFFARLFSNTNMLAANVSYCIVCVVFILGVNIFHVMPRCLKHYFAASAENFVAPRVSTNTFHRFLKPRLVVSLNCFARFSFSPSLPSLPFWLSLR